VEVKVKQAAHALINWQSAA